MCEPVKPFSLGAAGQYLSVGPASGTADRDVVVHFELRNAAGKPVKAYSGEGTKSGGCCPSVSFRADADDGVLVVADP